MFKPLGQFKRIPCPDSRCHRSPCLFSHTTASGVGQAAKAGNADSAGTRENQQKKDGNPGQAQGLLQKSSFGEPITKRRRIEEPGTTSPASVAWPDGSVSAKPNPPVLKADPRLSKQPVLDRRRGLQRLFDEFCRLYSSILPLDPTLPSRSAVAQELETAGTTNAASYNPAIHKALIEIHQRARPTTLDSPFIGTVKESQQKVREDEDRRRSSLDPEILQPYLLPLKDFPSWGYLTRPPSSEGDSEPEALGQSKICDRCGRDFVVSSDLSYIDLEKSATPRECTFHWGRTQPERVDGRKVWLYTCCKAPRGSEGCQEGLHVFKDDEDRFKAVINGAKPEEVMVEDSHGDQMLHRRKAFKTVKTVREEHDIQIQGLDVVALDCEMVYTSAGLSLARLSVINKEGKIVLDDIVKIEHTIYDLNTRFSGLSRQDMENATLTFEEVRAKACQLIDEKTVIVGHGLENDLKAMRLIHTAVVDTAVVFPHPRGAPFRRSLKDITSEKLGVFIQNDVLESGHDSLADARAALDIIKSLVKEDRSIGT